MHCWSLEIMYVIIKIIVHVAEFNLLTDLDLIERDLWVICEAPWSQFILLCVIEEVVVGDMYVCCNLGYVWSI